MVVLPRHFRDPEVPVHTRNGVRGRTGPPGLTWLRPPVTTDATAPAAAADLYGAQRDRTVPTPEALDADGGCARNRCRHYGHYSSCGVRVPQEPLDPEGRLSRPCASPVVVMRVSTSA